jgi:hypothetical protein
MKKKACIVTAVVLAFLLSISLAYAAGEASKHPRIRAAWRELGGAITELKAAPHDFGGHRAEAVEACEKAREQLKLALDYRAGADSHK